MYLFASSDSIVGPLFDSAGGVAYLFILFVVGFVAVFAVIGVITYFLRRKLLKDNRK